MADEQHTSLKKCSFCGQEKDRAEYFRCAACKDGLRGECKACVASKQRDYNKLNAGRISAQKKMRYWEDPESHREKAREYASQNAEAARARAKAWYWANHELASVLAKARRTRDAQKINARRAEYRERNAEQLKLRYREFYRENKERLRPGRKAAKAMRRSASGSVTKHDVRRLIRLQRERCAVCWVGLKKTGYHLDHIMPLARGGTNDTGNLQVLCPSCNLSKNAKHPIDFMQQLGRLL